MNFPFSVWYANVLSLLAGCVTALVLVAQASVFGPSDLRDPAAQVLHPLQRRSILQWVSFLEEASEVYAAPAYA